MKIIQWAIDRLIPYARNARKIPQAAIDKVAASIPGAASQHSNQR